MVARSAADAAADFQRVFYGNKAHFIAGLDDMKLGFSNMLVLHDFGERFLFVDGKNTVGKAGFCAEGHILHYKITNLKFHGLHSF